MFERNDMCDTIERYARKKGFPEIRCYIATLDNGAREYAICDNEHWLYGSNLSEAVACHIDMMYLTERK